MDETKNDSLRVAEAFATALLTRLSSDDMFQQTFLAAADPRESMQINNAIRLTRPLVNREEAAAQLARARLQGTPEEYNRLEASLQPHYDVLGYGAVIMAELFAKVGLKAGLEASLKMTLPPEAGQAGNAFAKDAPVFARLCRSIPRPH